VSTSDPYKVLQVDPEAEPEVIEAAYRRLARKYHPDVAPGPDAQERMVRINQAWELLRDPVRRAAVGPARAVTQAARVAPPTRISGLLAAGAAARRSRRRVLDPERDELAPSPSGPYRADPVPMPGMRDPSDETPPGSYADARFASGEATAGPPPGNASGSVLSFGRYAGLSLGEIARVEIGYLEWLDRMPIGRIYRQEIDGLLRKAGRRTSSAVEESGKRGLFRRR
jgi:curved DNA-binding protein CbpA